MKLRFFQVDDTDRVVRVPQSLMEQAWWRRRPWNPQGGDATLRLIQVVCDDRLLPKAGFLLKAQVYEGWITWDSLGKAAMLMNEIRAHGQSNVYCPVLNALSAGWPSFEELTSDLAQVLDVPVDRLPPIGAGGPLAVATQMNLSLRQVMTYWPEDRLFDDALRSAD